MDVQRARQCIVEDCSGMELILADEVEKRTRKRREKRKKSWATSRKELTPAEGRCLIFMRFTHYVALPLAAPLVIRQFTLLPIRFVHCRSFFFYFWRWSCEVSLASHLSLSFLYLLFILYLLYYTCFVSISRSTPY